MTHRNNITSTTGITTKREESGGRLTGKGRREIRIPPGVALYYLGSVVAPVWKLSIDVARIATVSPGPQGESDCGLDRRGDGGTGSMATSSKR